MILSQISPLHIHFTNMSTGPLSSKGPWSLHLLFIKIQAHCDVMFCFWMNSSLMFPRIIVPSSVWSSSQRMDLNCLSLMMKAVRSFETSQTTLIDSMTFLKIWIFSTLLWQPPIMPHHIFIHFVIRLSVFLCHTWLPVVWSNICKVQRIKYVILFMQVDSGWPGQPNYPRDVAAWWFKCRSKGTKTWVIEVLKLTDNKWYQIDGWLTNGTICVSHLLALHNWKVSECQNLIVLLLINYSKMKSLNWSNGYSLWRVISAILSNSV